MKRYGHMRLARSEARWALYYLGRSLLSVWLCVVQLAKAALAKPNVMQDD